MKLNRDEVILYLDCSSLSHKKTRVFAYSISNHVQEYNFEDVHFTKSKWQDILNMLDLRPKDLLNKANPTYQKEIAGKSFDEDAWYKILIKNPFMIKAPIAIMNERAILCLKPKDIYKLVPKVQEQY